MTGHNCPGEDCARCSRAVAAIEDDRLAESLEPDFDGWQGAQDAFERDLGRFDGTA